MALSVTPTDEMKTLTVGEKIYEIVDDQAREDVSEVKADFLQNVIYDTASGAVATFSDGAHGLPCKSVVAQIVPVQSGSGDPSPDNVRPISGWDAVRVEHAGKNLANPSIFSVDKPSWSTSTHWLGLTANADGTFTLTRPIGWGGNGFVYIGTYKAGTYTISYDLLDTAGVTCGASFFAVSTLTWQRIAGGSAHSLTAVGRYRLSVELSETAVLMLAVGPFTTNGAEVVSGNYQVELGSTPTPYEPYTGTTYPVTLPQTVYGGQVDVVSGEGKVTYGMVDLGTLTWTYDSTRAAFNALINPMKNNGALVCSAYKWNSTPSIGAPALNDMEISASPFYTAHGIMVKDHNYSDSASFATAVSGVMLVYERTTPTDFSVTPQEVSTLYGSNMVYADSGDVAVEYPADTKLYISRLTEPDSEDMIADANIVSGKYFMVGNDLYLATANIANGGAIVPGTNCTKVSLATALNAINS